MPTKNHPLLASSINFPTFELPGACSSPKYHYFFRICFCLFLVLAYPVSRIVPHSWAWENGVFEWAQVFVLFFALATAFRYSKKAPNRYLTRFWFYQIPIWLVLLGRETNWGTAFFPYRAFDPSHGPVLVSYKSLWYGSAVYPVLGILLIFTIYKIVKHRLYRLPWELLRQKRFPVLTLVLTILSMILANCFEQSIFFSLPNDLNFVLEEYLETLFYLGLVATDIGINFQTRTS